VQSQTIHKIESLLLRSVQSIGVGGDNFWGVRRMFWPNFPKCARKLFVRQTFPDKFFCSSWLLINSHKLKHEVTPKKQFVDFMYIQCVFYDIINFYLRAQKQKCLISLILLKNVGTSVSKFFEILPDFSTNQTLLRVHPQFLHHWSKVLFKLFGTKETLYATYNFSKFFYSFPIAVFW